ncbi:MAG TPA: tetratricopeptide repeat protein [Polyangia bacterium]|nr:tetratricopeptide repeat protein [Polyangia bacterium]
MLVLIAAAATVCAARSAVAQGKSTNDSTPSAREVYRDATQRYDMNDFPGALEGFKRAYALHSDPVILYNMAQCYRQLGDDEQAVKFYQSYLRNSTSAPNAQQVTQLIATLEQSISAKRAEHDRREVEERELARKRIEAETAERNARAAAIEAETAAKRQGFQRDDRERRLLDMQRGRREKIAGLTIAVIGVALLAGGAAFAALAHQESNNLSDTAAKGGAYDPSRQSAGSRDQAMGIGFLAGGGLAVATGVLFYGLGYRDSRRWSLTTGVGKDSASIALQGRF